MLRTLLFGLLLAAARVRAQRPDFDLPVPLPQLEATAQRDSNDPAAHYNLALGYWKNERYDAAESEFHLAMRLDPDFAPSFLGSYALTYSRWPDLWRPGSKVTPDIQKKGEEADRLFEHAIMMDPLVDLRPLGVALPPTPAAVYQDVDLHVWWNTYVTGFQDVFDGQYANGFDELTRLMHNLPRRDSVPSGLLWWHGIAAAHLGRDSVAESDFRRLVDRATAAEHSLDVLRFPIKTAEYDYLLAWSLMRLGRAPEAVRRLHDALIADAGLYEAHVRLAEIAEAGEDWDDAVGERRAAADANPDNPHLLVYLAATLVKAGRIAEAEDPLRTAIAANPRDFRAYLILGIVETELGKSAAARAALSTALALTPSGYQSLLAGIRKRLAELPQ